MHIHQIEEARALAPIVIHTQTAVDTTPAFVIQYVPDLGDSGSSAGVRYTSGETMAFSVDGAAADSGDGIYGGGDSLGSGTPGFIWTGLASLDTVGEMYDIVAKFAAWRIYLVAAIRADSMSYILTQSAGTTGEEGLTFYFDSSVSAICGTAVSGEKFVNSGLNGHVKDADDECENQADYIYTKLTFSSVGTTMKYYSGEAGQTESLLVAGARVTTATAYEDGEANYTEPYIKSARGQRLVVRTDCDSVLATSNDPTAVDFKVIGKTAVLANNRIVDEDNY